MRFPTILFKDGEDFTIEFAVNCPVIVPSAEAMLLGVWSGEVASLDQSSWAIWIARDGKISFRIVDSNRTVRATPPSGNLFSGRDLHIAVVRYQGKITLYLDGTDAGSVLYSGASADSTREVDTHWPHNPIIGKMLHLRIFKNHAKYKHHFTRPTIFPAYPRLEYTSNVKSKISAQYGFRKNSLQNETGVGSGQLFGNTNVVRGRLVSPLEATSYFQLPCAKFGLADFTIECRFNISSVDVTYGTCIIGHWKSAGHASDENRWAITLSPTGTLSFFLSRSDLADDSAVVHAPEGTVVFGKTYHVVVERVAGKVSVYLNEVKVAESVEMAFAVRGAEPFVIRSLSSLGVYKFSGSVWNIRVADAALYKGNVKSKTTFPRMFSVASKPIPVFELLKSGSLNTDFTNYGATLVNGAARVQSGQYLTLPSNAKYAFGTRDFTVESEFTIHSAVDGTGPAAGSSVTTLFYWGTWWHTNKANNWEVVYNNLTKNIAITVGNFNTRVQQLFSVDLTFNTSHQLQLTRKAGILSLYVNGAKIGEVAFAHDIALNAAEPLRVGRRLGGTVGDAIWHSDMTVKSLNLYDVALPAPLYKEVSIDLINLLESPNGLVKNVAGEVYSEANQHTAPGDGALFRVKADPQGRKVKQIRARFRYTANTSVLSTFAFDRYDSSGNLMWCLAVYDDWNNQAGFKILSDDHNKAVLDWQDSGKIGTSPTLVVTQESIDLDLVRTFDTPVDQSSIVMKIGGRSGYTYAPIYVSNIVFVYE